MIMIVTHQSKLKVLDIAIRTMKRQCISVGSVVVLFCDISIYYFLASYNVTTIGILQRKKKKM